MAEIVFADTETNGLRHDARPWEVGFITRDDDGLEQRYRWFVANFSPADADPTALQMSGFYDRHPYAILRPGSLSMQAELDAFTADADLPDLDMPTHTKIMVESDLALAFEQLSRGRVLVACNPAYDVPVLTRMLIRSGIAPTWHYRPVCATTEAAGYLRGRGVDVGEPPYVNAEIGRLLGVERDQFGKVHTALSDAYYARALYDATRSPVAVQ